MFRLGVRVLLAGQQWITDLAETLAAAVPSASRTVRELEDQGLVDRNVKKRMEPMKMLVGAMMALSLAASAARPQPAPHSIVGKWYGTKEGSPLTAEFRQDGTATFKVDADSNASYTCRYRVDERASPVALDLLGIRPESFNMQCAAVVV